MLQVIVQQRPAHAAERLLHRRHLRQHVGAVALLLDHLLQAAHLALDPPEPGEHRALDLGIHRDGVGAVAGTGAAGAGDGRSRS